MKYLNSTVFVFILFSACKQHKQPSSAIQKTDSIKQEALYPFPQYIQSQIAYVDSATLGIEMIVYENGTKKDSGFITREIFRQLASQFMDPDPNEKKWRSQYEETSFLDLSINTITFSITSKNEKSPLQVADILLNPDNKQVKYLVLKKREQKNSVLETTNLMWTHNMNFQISTSSISEDGKENTRVVKVIWDKPVGQF
ncbi:hypothetical protein BH10BAC3_BH10BAC3_02720 [soil metagenome]